MKLNDMLKEIVETIKPKPNTDKPKEEKPSTGVK